MVSNVETPASNGARPLPDHVRIIGAPRFSANQLRQLRAVTGLELEQLMTDSAAMLQAYAYTLLRRDGYEVSWEEAGDVLIEFADETPDPTYAGNATASPDSAGSGE